MFDLTGTGQSRSIRALAVAGLLAMAAGGCSGADSGVELNGKIFDVVGLTGVGKKGAEPRLAERAPLVPPPSVAALPQPGVEQASSGHMAWPDDPDRRKSALASNDKQKLQKYCSDPLIGRPEHERTARQAECSEKQGGLLSMATSLIPGQKKEVAAETSDEGDPGIVTGSTAAPAGKAASAPPKAAAGTKTR